MKNIIKFLLILSMFFLFFDGFILSLGNNHFIYYYTIFTISLLVLNITFNYKFIIKKIKFLYLKTPFKYLTYFFIWLFLDSIILIITQKATFLTFYYIFVKLLIPFILCYFISAFFIPKYISIKSAIKVLFFSAIIFIILGFVGYIGDTYNISFCSGIVNSFSNLKSILQNVEIMQDTISGSARMRSIFHEPGVFAKYILLSLPIILPITLSKYKIFENKFVNKSIKVSIIPLFIISLILTKSPIYLVFTLIFFLCYFYKQILIFIRKYFFLIFVLFIILIPTISKLSIDLSNTYLYRITNVISSIKSFDMLVLVEQSLASRIVSYVNSFILFLKEPLFGYGYDNVRFYMTQQYINSPLTLTPENNLALQEALNSNQGCAFNRTLLWGLLSETGIIGTFLYFLFLYKNIKYIDKLKLYFQGIELKFLEGLKTSIIVVIATSFYIYSFGTSYLYLYYGLVCSYIVQYYINKGVNK